VGVAENNESTPVVTLSQNYPNPMRNSTTIFYFIPNEAKNSRINIYDISGRLVRTIKKTGKEVGYHRVVWDGQDNSGKKVANGVYFYKIKAGDYTITRKMIVVR
ncbi:MAG: T9SS type A sorting domain-containing protein, partial [Candidatus Cloacimonadota bacterium]